MEDRVTTLPESLISPLQEHLSHAKRLHAQDVAQRVAPVYLPFALERKYPHAGRLWIWPYVFPSDRLSKDPRTGIIRRHHASASGLQKAVSPAGLRYQGGARTAGPQRCEDDDDVYACAESRPTGRAQSPGLDVRPYHLPSLSHGGTTLGGR